MHIASILTSDDACIFDVPRIVVHRFDLVYSLTFEDDFVERCAIIKRMSSNALD